MKKQMKKNKVGIISLASLLALGVIAGTIAYFSTTTSMENVFAVGNPEAQFVEEFAPPPDGKLIYGSNFAKTGKVLNTGDYPVVARAKITAKWVDAATGLTVIDNTLKNVPSTAATNPLDAFGATLNFGATATFTDVTATDVDKTKFPFSATITTNDGKWLYNPETTAPDKNFGYFYYNDLVSAKTGGTAGESSALLDSVYISNGLGETIKTEVLYFDKGNTKGYTDYYTAKTALDGGATDVYRTQAAFVTANPDKTMMAVQTAILTNPEFKDVKLLVEISSLIVQADKDSVKAAYGIDSTSTDVLKTVYDAWVAEGLKD